MEESREHRMEEGREGGVVTLHLCWKSIVIKVSCA